MPARRRPPRAATRREDYRDAWGFPPYVTAAERRRNTERTLQALRRSGREVSPVITSGRQIATTFWGAAWCTNLERYGDYANRIPRGRTYVRNGSVIDLQIRPGAVEALVSGSEVYTVRVDVGAVGHARWKAICARCAGAIDSLVELLQGRFSQGVMEHLCQQGTGLFPSPAEIRFSCSCPDAASMCKHVAAVLYGIGARLDHQPELLFRLRRVDERDLLATAGRDIALAKSRPSAARLLPEEDVSDVFGIELATLPETPASGTRARGRRTATAKKR